MQSNDKSVAKALTIVVMVLAALPLAAGGAWLLALGGSPYYLIAGLVLALVSWLYARDSTSSVWLYAVLLLGTIVWGIWESSTDFWALAPRLDSLTRLNLH